MIHIPGARWLWALLAAALLSACGGGSSQDGAAGASSAANTAAAAPSTGTTAGATTPATSTASSSTASTNVTPANTSPKISGTPITTVMTGAVYSFTPTASDANGDTLTFSVQNKPSWATFNIATGQLSGTPAAANAGNYANVIISVSDGLSSTALPAFSITVSAAALGSATLSWTVPTQNTDGSVLTDLAGYHIYYGTNAANLSQVINLTNSSATSYVIGSLTAGTYYFAVKAYNSSGVESDLSNVASKSI